jgi:uncharacterized protein (TIGR00369 family)
MSTKPVPRGFEHYDAKLGERLIGANDAVTGLPAYLGIRLLEFGPGRLVAEMPVREELKTPFGNLHGGVMAGLVDHVLGVVAYPLMRRGQWAATTEFKLNYLAAVSEGTLRAESQVVSMTRTTAIVRVEVWNGERLACIAQGTLLVRDPKPAA